ncbi:MAG: PDDEXK nuclease domain-containing protein [Candidatus Wallbacteria bacterium]|nr:PDDEXK nuclease domain-containing protein [Candidatus Wallbacteria bacterium]
MKKKPTGKFTDKPIMPAGTALFDRVVSILEQARTNVVHSVNSQMVIAYWLIGREIVQEVQGGDQRAEYGMQVVENLSAQLTEKYRRGFSTTNLWYFRQFYLVFQNRPRILHPAGGESLKDEKVHKAGGESTSLVKLSPGGKESLPGFNTSLSWSHYRALMRVDNPEAREFYEKEAVECGWSKMQLERQIQTAYFERILKNKGKDGLIPANRERLTGEAMDQIHLLKSPFVLEFLDLPDSPDLHEKDLEQAIITNLQSFLLELGRGFSFVARQKNIRFDDDDFYVDLVFYNFMLKFFLLIDLKIGKLTHQDVGQMDGYVRLFEDRFKVQGDNPTIGLILCSDKSKAIAKYSVLIEGKQIFAAEYLKFLPSEKELQRMIQKERRLIEMAMEGNKLS